MLCARGPSDEDEGSEGLRMALLAWVRKGGPGVGTPDGDEAEGWWRRGGTRYDVKAGRRLAAPMIACDTQQEQRKWEEKVVTYVKQ